jgi:hypothetical protein
MEVIELKRPEVSLISGSYNSVQWCRLIEFLRSSYGGFQSGLLGLGTVDAGTVKFYTE